MNLPTLKFFSFEDKEETTTTSTPPVGFTGMLVHFYSAFDEMTDEKIYLRNYANGVRDGGDQASSSESNNVNLINYIKTNVGGTDDVKNANFKLGENDFLYFDPQGDLDEDVGNDTRLLTLLDVLNSTTTNEGYKDDVKANQLLNEKYMSASLYDNGYINLSLSELEELYNNDYFKGIINAQYEAEDFQQVKKKYVANNMYQAPESWEDVSDEEVEALEDMISFSLNYDKGSSTYTIGDGSDLNIPVASDYNYFVNGDKGLAVYKADNKDNTNVSGTDGDLNTLFAEAFWEYDSQNNVFVYNKDYQYKY